MLIVRLSYLSATLVWHEQLTFSLLPFLSSVRGSCKKTSSGMACHAFVWIDADLKTLDFMTLRVCVSVFHLSGLFVAGRFQRWRTRATKHWVQEILMRRCAATLKLWPSTLQTTSCTVTAQLPTPRKATMKMLSRMPVRPSRSSLTGGRWDCSACACVIYN